MENKNKKRLVNSQKLNSRLALVKIARESRLNRLKVLSWNL